MNLNQFESVLARLHELDLISTASFDEVTAAARKVLHPDQVPPLDETLQTILTGVMRAELDRILQINRIPDPLLT